MVDWNKPIQTRVGLKARLVCADVKCGPLTHLVLIEYGHGEQPELRCKDGKEVAGTQDWMSDIINVPEES